MGISEYADDYFESTFGVRLTNAAHKRIEEYSQRFGEEEVLKAIEIACAQYDDALDAFLKIGGILYNRFVMKSKFITDVDFE